MNRINGYTPKQLAHEIAIGWLREVHADRTGDLSGMTESQRREVKDQIARLHDRLLSDSKLDGTPLA